MATTTQAEAKSPVPGAAPKGAVDPSPSREGAGPAEKRCESCGRSFAEDELFCPLDGAPLVARSSLPSGADPYIGLVILGQIEVQKLAGAGSMARVYKAFQRGVDRDVAVKILHRELSADPEVVRRFHQEAKVASRLSNPHLVHVFLTAELPKSPSAGQETCGELVLVTEFLDGMSLLSALGAAGGAMPLPRALHIVLQVCEALAEAHRNGVVHRDVKPENVMLVQRGEDRDFVKVLDFGLARLANKDASFATRQGAIFGSPRYISPEGAQGLPVGPTADVYAVATLLYQMLAGRTPFEADSPVGFLLAHTSEKAPRVSTHERASYVPAPIVALLEKNLSKDPGSRAADARVLANDLRAAAEEAGFSADALAQHDAWLGAPGEVAHALSSLQRTKQHTLSVEARAAIGAAPAEGAADRADPPQSEPPSAPSDGGDTTLETNPLKGHTMLAGEDELPRTSEPGPIVPTLFDAPSALALGKGGTAITGGAQKTKVLEPAITNRASSSRDLPDVPALEPPPPRSSRPSGDLVRGSVPPPPVALTPQLAASLPSVPPASSTAAPDSLAPPRTAPADTAPADTAPASPYDSLQGAPAAELPAERGSFGTVVFVVICFVLGGTVAVLGASRLGQFQEPPGAGTVTAIPSAAPSGAPDSGDRGSPDELLAAAAAAESRGEWEGKPTSVRESFQLLDRKFGGDPRVRSERHAVSARLVARAAEARQRNDGPTAARLCGLAIDLDGDNMAAKNLAVDLAREADRAVPLAPSAPGKVVPKTTGPSTASPPTTASAKDPPRWL